MPSRVPGVPGRRSSIQIQRRAASLKSTAFSASSFSRVLSSILNSDNMIRTQVSLDEDEYAIAKSEAQSLGISVAEFVRRAVRQALPPRGTGPWMKFAGFVETGNARSSQTIDEIVYGQKD